MKKIVICLLIMLLICTCFASCSERTVLGKRIIFPQPAENISLKNTEIIFSANVEGKNFSNKKVYFYNNAKYKDSEEIAKLFGFSSENVTSSSNGEKFYKDDQVENKDLTIDAFGCFIFYTGADETPFQMELTERQCMKIAREYLIEKNLFPDDISLKWTVSGLKTIEQNEETLLYEETLYGYIINFFRRGKEESTAFGNSRISVEINGNGEIVKIYYNYCTYSSKKRAKLIDISDAIEKIENENCYIEMECDCIPTKIVIDSVTLNYWAQDRSFGKSNIQPVYYFTGTAYDSSWNKSAIEIVVQANEY